MRENTGYLFVLSKDNIKLAKEEVLALAKNRKYQLLNNLLVLSFNNKRAINEEAINGLKERLAYTNKIYQVLFISSLDSLIKDINNFKWNNIYKHDFCIRLHSCLAMGYNGDNRYDEKNISSLIWKKLNKPRVNLISPKTRIEFFIIGNKVIASLFKGDTKKEFEQRKAHLRPEFFPVSLHPKLARAMVNLTGIDTGNILLDPFCGVGGILIEAGLIGIKTIGIDIDNTMLEKAMENMEYYKIKNYKLIKGDALKIRKVYDFIVTDLPYFRNSRVRGRISSEADNNYKLNNHNKLEKNAYLDAFYDLFLRNLRKRLRIKAVIGFPDSVDYKMLIKKNKLKLIAESDYYLHKSLSKRIVAVT